MATQLIDPVVGEIPIGENPEFYECINGRWTRKESVGRKRHSGIDMAV